MAGKKRTAEEAEDVTTSPARSTRASKAAKVDASPKAKAAKPKATPKGKKKAAAPSASKFKEEALPLHLHITHTPPSTSAAHISPEDKNASEPTVATDSGHIASITVLPTDFSTGSYGWKGASRVQIELKNHETGENEKVTVMINVNATVMGSKDAAKHDKDTEAEVEAEVETKGDSKNDVSD